MSRKDPLNRLTLTSPCTQDWNSMAGNDQVRFCEHCSRHVHNLSEMTREDALQLIRKSEGRLCVSYYRDPNGELLTRHANAKFHHISRRVSRIAAGAFSATLSLSAAVVQGSEDQRPTAMYSSQSQGPHLDAAVLTGRISDTNGASIAGATISIATIEGNRLYTSTNNTGEFRFERLATNSYFVHIEAPGFAPVDTQTYLTNGENRLDYTLTVATIEAEVEIRNMVQHVLGGISVVLPEDPFVRAAQEDDLDKLNSLIANSDVNLRDSRSGTTALEHAVLNSNFEMVQLLLSRGADPRARNGGDRTVLMMLQEDATTDLIWELINAGADANAKDTDGNTPLLDIAMKNNYEALKTLLDAGAKVEAANKARQTALMRAASSGLTNNVRLLLLAGSQVNATDEEGRNALTYATEYDHRAVIRLLKTHGAMTVVKPAETDE